MRFLLHVPTYVAPSEIAGVRLFAATELPAGTVVWEFDERVDWAIPPEDVARFPEPYRSRMRRYLYLDENGLYILCGDAAKFMNHSADPNCDDSDALHTVTRRAVRADEELTCDYAQFDAESRAGGLEFSAGRGGT